MLHNTKQGGRGCWQRGVTVPGEAAGEQAASPAAESPAENMPAKDVPLREAVYNGPRVTVAPPFESTSTHWLPDTEVL